MTMFAGMGLGGNAPYEPIRASTREIRTVIAFIVAPFGGAACFALLTISQRWHFPASGVISVAVMCGVSECLTVLPVMLIVRSRRVRAAAVPIAGVLGGVFLAQASLLPQLYLGLWGTNHTSAATAVTAAAIFFTIELLRASISPIAAASDEYDYEPQSRSGPWRILLAVFTIWAGTGVLFPELTIFWAPTDIVESYLARQTPLGSAYQDVVGWLGARGSAPRVEPRRPFPKDPATIASNNTAAISVTIETHKWVPFVTYVEATYTFNESNRLIAIVVRKEVDGP